MHGKHRKALGNVYHVGKWLTNQSSRPLTRRLISGVRLRTLDFTRVALQYHSMRTELVTTLKRQATDLLADIERDKKPILITQHGLPSAYLVDVESYQLQQERMTILEGIARGEVAVSEKRTLTQAQAEKRLGKWLK